jgi:hypothetical protein
METNGQPASSPVGEYHLTGVMETASGMRLNEDSTFDFYFSYGAIDREGHGKWQVKNNKIVLNSATRPALDFKLLNSKKEPGDRLILSITSGNSMVLSYVQFLINPGKNEEVLKTNSKGLAITTLKSISKLGLLFELCGDRPSYFENLNSDHNFFQFGFEPWICEVFFNDLEFEWKDGNIYGPHPLLQPKIYTYSGRIR